VMTIMTIGIFAWYVGADMWRSFQRGYETDSLVALPMWVPPFPLLLGMAVFLLDMCVLLVQVLSGSARVADESPEVI
jgi:TRAP-type C4-dicarboxylate transport system permease small subunit